VTSDRCYTADLCEVIEPIRKNNNEKKMMKLIVQNIESARPRPIKVEFRGGFPIITSISNYLSLSPAGIPVY